MPWLPFSQSGSLLRLWPRAPTERGGTCVVEAFLQQFPQPRCRVSNNSPEQITGRPATPLSDAHPGGHLHPGIRQGADMGKRKPMADAAFDMLPFRAQVALFHDLDEMARYHEKVLGIHDHGFHGLAANGMASMHSDSEGVHWFSLHLPEGVAAGTIVHECSHIVDFILDHHGVPLNAENTEIRAYMLERLFDSVTEHFARADKGA